jgi:hypothetical protein
MKSRLSRLVTLVLLAALAWWLFDYAVASEKAVEPPPTGGLLFPGVETRDVDYVSLKFRTGHVIDIERKPEGPWLITYPTDEYAQQEYVQALVDDLSRATFIPVQAQGEQVVPDDVGLGREARQITFRAAGIQHSLRIGDMDVFGKGVYALRDDEGQALKVTPSLLTMVEQFRGQDYVDKHLLRGLRGPVDHVRVVEPDGVLLDAVLQGGRWTIQAPTPGLGDGERIKTLVRTLQFAEQLYPADTEPLDGELSDLGLPTHDQLAQGDPSEATLVELGSGALPPARLFLEARWREREAETFCVRGDLRKILVFDKHDVMLLENGPDFFRARHVLLPMRERAKALTVERGGETLLAVRGDDRGVWTFRQPERLAGLSVDTVRTDGRSLLSDLLGRLDGLEATGFGPKQPEGDPEARLVVGWERSGREQRDTVSFWDLAGEQVRAVCSQRPGEVLLLPHEDVAALLDPHLADRLRELAPVEVPDEQWGRLVVVLPDGEQLDVHRPAAGTSWEGDDDWGRRFGLGHDLRELRGLAWQAAPSDAAYPWSVRYEDFDGALLGRLDLRRPVADEPSEVLGYPVAWARWSGVPDFELAVSRELLDRLDALTRPLERQP